MSGRIPVADGTVLTIDVLRWNEGWDFDCPVCVIRPVIRFSPNGDSADQMVESIAESADLDGFIESEPVEEGRIDRQFSLATLKRRWAEARRGKDFPFKQYTASRFRIRFVADADGLLYEIEASS